MDEDHRGYRYEFLDSGPSEESDVNPPAPLTSEHGAGSLGFAGTVRREAGAAAGLATLPGDGFGGGPAVPMVPGTWDQDEIDNENDFQ